MPTSIDDFARIMKDGNNGGYANNWLVADRKTNEIASLELGLKNVTLQRTKDGYFVGSNFPGESEAGQGRDRFRRQRQEQQRERPARALAAPDGAEQGQDRRGRGRAIPGRPLRYLRRQDRPRASAPCAATSTFRRAACGAWQPPYAPAGAVQNKVTDAAGAERCRSRPRWAMPAGLHFKAADHLAKHPEFAWYQHDPARYARARLDPLHREVVRNHARGLAAGDHR